MIGDEENLIERSLGGDGAAFGELYDRYHASIYRFILLRTGHKEEAEDLAHQVFLSAWEHMSGYVDKGYPFGSWLYRIARNRVVDHYRVKRDTTALDAPETAELAGAADLESDADRALVMERVERALRTLAPDHQEVIILRFVEELSLREAATAMERSEGAVKLLQHRAIKALRDKLAENLS